MIDADDNSPDSDNPVPPDPTRKDEVDAAGLDGAIPQVPKPSIRKILFRIVFIVAALGISGWILVQTFDDLDLDAIPVSYTHLTLPTKEDECRSRWSPYH